MYIFFWRSVASGQNYHFAHHLVFCQLIILSLFQGFPSPKKENTQPCETLINSTGQSTSLERLFQPLFTCSKPKMETPEQRIKSVQKSN